MDSDNNIYNDNIKPLEEMLCNIDIYDSIVFSEKFNTYFFYIQEYFTNNILKEGGNLKKYRKNKKGGGFKFKDIIKILKNKKFKSNKVKDAYNNINNTINSNIHTTSPSPINKQESKLSNTCMIDYKKAKIHQSTQSAVNETDIDGNSEKMFIYYYTIAYFMFLFKLSLQLSPIEYIIYYNLIFCDNDNKDKYIAIIKKDVNIKYHNEFNSILDNIIKVNTEIYKFENDNISDVINFFKNNLKINYIKYIIIYTEKEPVLILNDSYKILGEGSYGCAITPAIFIDDPNYTDIKNNLISKIFKTYVSFNTESIELDNISNIDIDNTFTLKQQIFISNNSSLRYNFLKTTKDFITEKESITKNFKITKIKKNYGKELYFINIENGGVTLNRMSKIDTFKFFKLLLPLIEGIKNLINKDIIHRDIKPANILIDRNATKINLIDFGLLTTKNKIFTESQDNILQYDYIFYPPEFCLIHIIYNLFIQDKFKDKKTFIKKLYDDQYYNYIFINIQDCYYKYYNNRNKNRELLYNYYKEIVENISVIMEEKGIFSYTTPSEKLKELEEIIIEFFDYKKIDIFSLGVTLMLIDKENNRINKDGNYNKYVELYEKMIDYDFRTRISTDEIINTINSMSGGKKCKGGELQYTSTKNLDRGLLQEPIINSKNKSTNKSTDKSTDKLPEFSEEERLQNAKDVAELLPLLRNKSRNKSPYKSPEFSKEERLQNAKDVAEHLHLLRK